MPDESPIIKFIESNAQLLPRIHHDRPVPRDGFADRLARDQQKTNRLTLSSNAYLFAIIKKYKIGVGYERVGGKIEIVSALNLITERIFLFAEISLAFNDICKNRVAGYGKVRIFRVGLYGYVEVLRIGNNISYRAFNTGDAAGDDLDRRGSN